MYDHVLIRRLNDALLDAYNRETLERMLLFQLGKRLDHIVEDGDLLETVYQLIEQAKREGWLNDLAQAAHASNEGNVMLAEVSAEFRKVTDNPVPIPKPEPAPPALEPSTPNPDSVSPLTQFVQKYARLLAVTLGGLVLALGGYAIFRPDPTPAPTAEVTPAPTPVPVDFEGRLSPISDEINGELIVWSAFTGIGANAVASGFEELASKYPGLRITLTELELDENGQDGLKWRYMQAAERDELPDVFLAPSDWGGEFAELGIVNDPLILLPQDDVDRIDSSALQNLFYDGQLVGVPYSTRGTVLVRNRELVSTAPASLDEIFALDDDVYDLEIGLYYSGATLAAQGGQLMDADGQPTFDNAAGVSWLESLQQFGDDQGYGNNDVDSFGQGRVGLVVEGTWNLSGMTNMVGAQKVKIDPWPEGMSGWVLYDVAYVSATLDPDKRDAVSVFLSQLVSRRVQTGLADVNHIPVATDATIGTRLMREAQRVLRTSEPFPIDPAMAQYWEPLTVAVNTVVLEDDDPASALEEAAGIIRARLK